jgi:excisionase family DNA binding protein
MKAHLETQDIEAIAQRVVELLKPYLSIREEPKVVPVHPKPKGHFMTAIQLAEYLQVSKGTIHNWIYQRKVPCFKIGRRVRFKRDDIEQWAEEKKVKASYDEWLK